MLVVAGLTIKNVHPRVWDPSSRYFLPELRAVMVSYAEFHAAPAKRRQAMERGLRLFLGVPPHVAVYLDNGAFALLRKGDEPPTRAYDEFVGASRPDWYA